jgi:hypothetical protein
LEDKRNYNRVTKIHIPGEIMNFLKQIDLCTASLDPFAPNARNKHKHPHLVSIEKRKRALEFKTHNDTPKDLTPSSSVNNATVTPPTTSKQEEEEEDELIRNYFEVSDKESNEESDKERVMVEDGVAALLGLWRRSVRLVSVRMCNI